ncbi:hypothetical protein OIO90_000994 [Microbotryomycetes sp. JL221]|nr:hypothetical protein OIO90_000994 [Microbotryomycetes sp. JL221]
MGGALLSFGAMLSLIVSAGSPGLAASNPGLVKLLSSAIFPLIVAGLLGQASGIFEADPYHSYVLAFADKKAVHPSWAQILCRGIGCNMLVCVAMFQASAALDIVSKIVAIELPVFAFVCLGYDHVVANMLFIPLAMILGAPAPLTTGYYIWKSLIPAFIGNVIGAAMFAIPCTVFFLWGPEHELGPDNGQLDHLQASGTSSRTRIDVDNKV